MGYGKKPTEADRRQIRRDIANGVTRWTGDRHSPEISTATETYRPCGCNADPNCPRCNGWGTLPVSHHGT